MLLLSNPTDPGDRRCGRLLTGGDLEVESVSRDKAGNHWFGEAFGPFLVKADANGTVQSVFRTPNLLALGPNSFVQPPSNPIPTGAHNLPGSGGFEGMAFNASGTRLHTLLERPLTTDTDQKRLLVQEFVLASSTLLVANDNNFPGGGGRNLMSDTTEFLRISLAAPVPEPGMWALMASGVALLGAVARRRRRHNA